MSLEMEASAVGSDEQITIFVETLQFESPGLEIIPVASLTFRISFLDSLSFLCEIREIFNEFVKNEILMHCIITVSKHINFFFWRFCRILTRRLCCEEKSIINHKMYLVLFVALCGVIKLGILLLLLSRKL